MQKSLFLALGLALTCLSLSASGCAPAISRNLMEQADRSIAFEDLLERPEQHVGKTVILGGMIVSTRNQQEGTLLEIVQKPLDFQERPQEGDETDGRFLALYNGYLDPAVYAEKREVTVAGTVGGKRERPLGEITYTYPFILAEEVHLWPVRVQDPAYYYPPGGWYSPWWRYPYWGPW